MATKNQDKTRDNRSSSSTKEDHSALAREKILDQMLISVPFEGWTSRALRIAAKKAGLSEGADELYFSGGVLEVIRFWSDQADKKAAHRLIGQDLETMRIRDKVTQGVLFRLEELSPHEEAARRAISRLTLLDAFGQAPSQLWASADSIWRAIGDKSTDGNYYSKRVILSAVLGSSTLSWLGDNSADKDKARAFVNARIENVMQFEKAKWDFQAKTETLPNMAEILGKIRYGSRRRRRRPYR